MQIYTYIDGCLISLLLTFSIYFQLSFHKKKIRKYIVLNIHCEICLGEGYVSQTKQYFHSVVQVCMSSLTKSIRSRFYFHSGTQCPGCVVSLHFLAERMYLLLLDQNFSLKSLCIVMLSFRVILLFFSVVEEIQLQ